MKVNEFVKMEKSGVLFTVINADKVGYMTDPSVLLIADKNLVGREYANATVVGFEPISKRNIKLYISFK